MEAITDVHAMSPVLLVFLALLAGASTSTAIQCYAWVASVGDATQPPPSTISNLQISACQVLFYDYPLIQSPTFVERWVEGAGGVLDSYSLCISF